MLIEGLTTLTLIAGLFLTARRRNGWTGLHDLASGTRVVSRSAAGSRTRIALGLDAGDRCATLSLGAAIRAFPGSGRRSSASSATSSWDSIRCCGGRCGFTWCRRSTRAIDAVRRDCLTHRTSALADRPSMAPTNWDAFEAPDGHPLVSAANGRTRGARSSRGCSICPRNSWQPPQRMDRCPSFVSIGSGFETMAVSCCWTSLHPVSTERRVEMAATRPLSGGASVGSCRMDSCRRRAARSADAAVGAHDVPSHGRMPRGSIVGGRSRRSRSCRSPARSRHAATPRAATRARLAPAAPHRRLHISRDAADDDPILQSGNEPDAGVARDAV